MDLRTLVLEASIGIEDGLSNFLSDLFNIKKDDSLTLGIRSSSISLRTKVDLLKDLNRISADEQKIFMLFMEIRNKLIHNLSIDTMLKAVKSLDKSRVNQLLKSYNEDNYIRYQECKEDEDRDRILITAFYGLTAKLHEIIKDAYKSLLDETKKQSELEKAKVLHKVMNEAFDVLKNAIDKFSDTFDEVYNPEGNSEIMQKGFVKKLISATFQKEMEDLHPDLKDYYDKSDELEQPKKA